MRRYERVPDVTCRALSGLDALWRAVSRLVALWRAPCRGGSWPVATSHYSTRHQRERVEQDQSGCYPKMLKRFSEWFGLKKKLHERQQTPPLISEREVWWASVGENVGSEVNGKSALFSRPVIIYKKLSDFISSSRQRRKRKRGVGSFASDISGRT